MNKETYQKESSELKNKIEALKHRQSILTIEYIEKNSVFKIGDRVKVGNEYGYVVGLHLDHKDNVTPKCLKEKKDGTKSMHSLYVWTLGEVELADKNNLKQKL